MQGAYLRSDVFKCKYNLIVKNISISSYLI